VERQVLDLDHRRLGEKGRPHGVAPTLKSPRNEADQIPPMQRYLISRKSSMPYFEPSRPVPDSFMPPKGATSVEIIPVLMPTMPYSTCSATRQTRPMSRL